VLGWKDKIGQAANNPKKIAELKSLVRLFVQLKMEYEAKNKRHGMRISTFSDNVVISANPSNETLVVMMLILAGTQLLAARRGHYIRGGMTIGNIVHDDDVVFGPGLNQAYHLESEVAQVPRIVIDRNCVDHLFSRNKFRPGLLVRQRGTYFLNPWTLPFAEFTTRHLKKDLSPRGTLTLIFYELVNAWEVTEEKTARSKLIWLCKRILAGLETEPGVATLEDTRSLRRFLT
jgi:hypothetical protein